jgi:phage/plasmid primase-like uncharacterized protein
MTCLVERVPLRDDPVQDDLFSSGVHVTFLCGPDKQGSVRKARTESNKLTRGQIRGGGVWLTPYPDIGRELAVAEGIETALSVQQISRIPTVAALSAVGMQTFRWPPMVRRLWIAADNDPVGIRAAHALAARALDAGLDVNIKMPPNSLNDFNDFLNGRQ